MKSPSTVDKMLARVTAELEAAPDDDRRRELAALQSGLLWCRHDYIWDERITRIFPTDPAALSPGQEPDARIVAAALVIAGHNSLSHNHTDFIEAGRALHRGGLLTIRHPGRRS